MEEWERLVSILDEVQLHQEDVEDEYTLIFEKSAIYSTRSMYRSLVFTGADNRRMDKLWRNKAPMNIRVFMLLVFPDKLQTGVITKKKTSKGNCNCCLCGVPEDINHVFFGCILAKTFWACFREAWGWDKTPKSLQDICDHWLPLNTSCYQIKFFMFSVILRVLWTIHN